MKMDGRYESRRGGTAAGAPRYVTGELVVVVSVNLKAGSARSAAARPVATHPRGHMGTGRQAGQECGRPCGWASAALNELCQASRMGSCWCWAPAG